MAELGQQTVDFSTLVTQAAGESYSSLKELVEQCRSNKDLSDAEKKINLLKFVNKTQQRMLRLDVLSKWCQQVPLVNYCQQLASTISNHETCLTQAADSLFFMHDGLQQARAPIYDVPSATEILLTGTYQRFPKCAEEIGAHGTLAEDQQKQALKKLDTLVRSKLLEVSMPKEFSELKVSDGTVLISVSGEYKVLVTLGYRGHLNLWRILHLDLLVGEKSGPVKLEESRRHIVGDDIERRMAAAVDPFVTLHSVLHELCVALIMDTVIRQVQALRLGRWKGALRFDLVLDSTGQGGASISTQMNNDGETESVSLGTPGLKIVYWLNSDKSSGTPGSGSCPFILVEPGSDMKIKCLHSSFVVDPATGNEAEFVLETSCIDVEKLLLRAIYCNRYTRLLEIQRELVKDNQVHQAIGDILLDNLDEPDVNFIKTNLKKCQGKEVLRVRAYGSSYFILGISIRSGRFLLQMSRNFLAPSALLEFEDSLNQRSVSAAEVFISLRSRSILHFFASIGRFLGLQVYEHDSSMLKVPKSMVSSSSSIVMGFPDRGGSFYLLAQLDKDFKPVFQLLEFHPDSNIALQVKQIDTVEMKLMDDETNLSLLDLEKVLPQLLNGGIYSQKLQQKYLSSSQHETECHTPTFASFVDSIFDLQNGASTIPFSDSCDLSHEPAGSMVTENDDTELWKTSLRKRKIDAVMQTIPSLGGANSEAGRQSKRKVSESAPTETLKPGDSYADFIAEAGRGSAPNSIYVSAFLHVIKHCSLCIHRARLISQMEALKIPYSEEIGLTYLPSNLWFRLPFVKDYSWPYLYLQLGKPGSMNWNVKIIDHYFTDLWEIQKGNSRPQWDSIVFNNSASDIDSRIRFDPEGLILSYKSVEVDSIKNLVTDIRRLSNARKFVLGMQKLIGVKSDQKMNLCVSKSAQQMRKSFRIDKVGLTSLWFTYGLGSVTRFVVEWEPGKEGCTVHVSPEQLWPHTKFLEDFIDGTEIASLLDCICLTAGPLHALAAATRIARPGLGSAMAGPAGNAFSMHKQSRHVFTERPLLYSSRTYSAQATSSPKISSVAAVSTEAMVNSKSNVSAVMVAAGGAAPDIVASLLLPTDVSIVFCGPYWIHIVYRKQFAIDMRCFDGDQVWLQPATPPQGGPSVGGSLSCPQFRLFIMEHVAQEINAIDSNGSGSQLAVGYAGSKKPSSNLTSQLRNANNSSKGVYSNAAGVSWSESQLSGSNLSDNAQAGFSNASVITSARLLRKSPISVLPAHKRGELNAAIVGLGDDGGYGGAWVPHVALKKVLRSVLRYLGVLWLFSQLPDLLKEILGSILKDNEGALMNLDGEQPALRFFVGNYVFAVSVHRVQLLLQVLTMKRFQQQQPHQLQQQLEQQAASSPQEEFAPSEILEICDYFSRRVASEPYDVSRVASFVTLLTLPIPVLREFLKLISWKKGLSQEQGADVPPAQKLSLELSLENHGGVDSDSLLDYCTSKSNIHYNRPENFIDFGLTAVLDATQIPHVDSAGGSAWLPYCVSVRLRYLFGESHKVSFLGMEGSHGGRACWIRLDDWEKCKQVVVQTVEANGSSNGEIAQGRLRVVADSIQKTLHLSLQGLKDGVRATASTRPG